MKEEDNGFGHAQSRDLGLRVEMLDVWIGRRDRRLVEGCKWYQAFVVW